MPGYTVDLFSAFYPMALVSPAIQALRLEDHGLAWTHASTVVGHARSSDDDDAPVIHHDVARTAADLERRCAGDGDAWLRLFDEWRLIKDGLLDSLFAPFPPVAGPARLLRRLGTGGTLRFLHRLLMPATVLGEKLFRGDAPRTLLLGNAMHADVPVDAPASGLMGYLMSMLAQDVGFPVPIGGAGQFAAALVARAQAAGAEIECNQRVDAIDVRGGRAVAVMTEQGHRVVARRAIIADVSAPDLYRRLLPREAVSDSMQASLDWFVWDTPVVKVNYALDAAIPWLSQSLQDAGTVHLGADADGLVRWMADLNTGTVPTNPFMLFGQMSTADATRSPSGTESAWAYSHLPRGVVDDRSARALAGAIDRVAEQHAPGFGDRIIARTEQLPSSLQAADANLKGGAVNGGTSALFQQLIFRPVPGLGRPETPIEGLYLGSAAVSPGGSVHGICGRNAALAALAADGWRGWPRRKTNRALTSILTR
jgi:phytoene dehydrogenase-like protein